MTFRPGQSGNPTGRKPGTRNKRLELLQSNDKRLQKKVLDMAMEGDPSALKIIADRLWPRLRAQASPVSIDAASDDIAEQGRKIIDAALSGEVTADVLRDLLAALYAQGKLIELTELERRLQALEAREETPPWLQQPERELLPIRGRRRRERESRS